MARIAGIDIPRNKRIDISITYVFGIGRTNGGQILERANVNPATRVRDLTEEELVRNFANLRGDSAESAKVDNRENGLFGRLKDALGR
jgi:ribosomal protein S13